MSWNLQHRLFRLIKGQLWNWHMWNTSLTRKNQCFHVLSQLHTTLCTCWWIVQLGSGFSCQCPTCSDYLGDALDENLLGFFSRGIWHFKLLPKITKHPCADAVHVTGDELPRTVAGAVVTMGTQGHGQAQTWWGVRCAALWSVDLLWSEVGESGRTRSLSSAGSD